MLKAFLIFALLSGLTLISTGVARAVPPDFSICDGLSGAAFGVCRAGVAVGCADEPPSGTPEACTSIEDQFVATTGEEPPWIVPPPALACPCDFSLVSQAAAEWTSNPDFFDVSYSCFASSTVVNALFSASAADALTLFPPQLNALFNPFQAQCAAVMADGTGETRFGLAFEEALLCREAIIAYRAEFVVANPEIIVDDVCTQL